MTDDTAPALETGLVRRFIGPLCGCLAVNLGYRLFVAVVRWEVPDAIHPFLQCLIGFLWDVATSVALFGILVAAALVIPSGTGTAKRIVRFGVLTCLFAIASGFIVILVSNLASVVYWGANLGPEDLDYLLDVPFLWNAISTRAIELPLHALGLVGIAVAGATTLVLAWRGVWRAVVISRKPVSGIVCASAFAVSGLVALTATNMTFVRGSPLETHAVTWMIARSLSGEPMGNTERGVEALHDHLRRLGAEPVVGSESASRNIRRFGLPATGPGATSVTRDGRLLRPGTNVIIILLESFGGQPLSERPEVTTNLRRILDDGVELRRHFTTMYRTFGAEFAVLCSMYNPSRFLVSRSFPDTRLECLPSLLKGLGYSTIAVSADSDPFDKESEWQRANDFDKVLTIDDLRDAGASRAPDDEILYDRILTELESAPKPVFLLGVAETNHYPYVVPPGFDAAHPETRDWKPVFRTMRFADEAFGRFHAAALRTEWGRNTLFVVFGDHGPWMHLDGGPDADADYPATRKRYHVLAGLLHPDLNPRRIDRVTSHVDLAPTILSLLGVTLQTDFVGQSVFDPPVTDFVLSLEAQTSSVLVLHDDTGAWFRDFRSGLCRAVTAIQPHHYRACEADEKDRVDWLREAFLDTTATTIRAKRLR